MTSPQPLPKRVLHRLRSSASYFHLQHPLLPHLPVTSILPSIFPATKYFKRQFLRKMQKMQLALLLFIVCRKFPSSLILCNTSSFLTRSLQLCFSSTMFQNFPDTSVLLSAVSTFQHHTWRNRDNLKEFYKSTTM